MAMLTRNLFMASVILLLIGLSSLWSKWNGSAAIHAGYPVQKWDDSFNGSVRGWPAMIGVLALLAAIILLVVAVIRSLMD